MERPDTLVIFSGIVPNCHGVLVVWNTNSVRADSYDIITAMTATTPVRTWCCRSGFTVRT